MIFKEFHFAVNLTQHGIAVLARLQKQGAVAILRPVQALGRIERGAHAETIEKPAGPVRERAAHGPGFGDGIVKSLAVKVVAPGVEVDLGVAKKSRRILQALLQRVKHRRRENPFAKGYLDGRYVFLHRRRKRVLQHDQLLRPNVGGEAEKQRRGEQECRNETARASAQKQRDEWSFSAPVLLHRASPG